MNSGNIIVSTICEAWQAKQPEKLARILSQNFEWYDSPFEKVINEQQQLIRRWHDDIALQQNIDITWDIITETENTIVAHWHAEFDRDNVHETLDGIFVIGTSEDGLLRTFRMWWVNQ